MNAYQAGRANLQSPVGDVTLGYIPRMSADVNRQGCNAVVRGGYLHVGARLEKSSPIKIVTERAMELICFAQSQDTSSHVGYLQNTPQESQGSCPYRS
jgi:hypothetical protein